MIATTFNAPEEPLPITEDWLREVGFKWHQMDRQPDKHWLLWLGDVMDGCNEDFGIELAPNCPTDKSEWFCWLRADTSCRYSRFIHTRHLKYQHELIRMIEGLTDRDWNPSLNLYGSMRTPEQAARIHKDDKRLDRQILRDCHPWHESEKDDSIGRPLHEHQQAWLDLQKK